MARTPRRKPKQAKAEKKVTRYTYDDIKEPRTPETGHTSLLPADEQVVTLPMDNGWSKAIEVGKLPEGDERPVVVDMDPAADPVLFWAGKRNRREVPVLPLQRNEIVSESRIAQIIERARRAADEKSGAARQGHLFADLEKTLRETDRSQARRVLHPRGGLEEQAHLRRLAARDGVAAPLREPARQGADDLHRPAVRHQVRLELSAAGGFDEERREGAGGRRAHDQGVSGHVGARDPLVPLLPAGASLSVPRAAGGDAAASSFRSATRTFILSRTLLDEVFGARQLLSADHRFTKTASRSDLWSGADLSTTSSGTRKDKTSASSISQLYHAAKPQRDRSLDQYTQVELADGTTRRSQTRRAEDESHRCRTATTVHATSICRLGWRIRAGSVTFEFEGRTYLPARRTRTGRRRPTGCDDWPSMGRICSSGKTSSLQAVRRRLPLRPIDERLGRRHAVVATAKHYVVQTLAEVVERCIADDHRPRRSGV